MPRETRPAVTAGENAPVSADSVVKYGCLFLFLLSIPGVNFFVFLYGMYWLVTKIGSLGAEGMIGGLADALDLGMSMQWDRVETNLGPALRMESSLTVGGTMGSGDVETVLTLESGGEPVRVADTGEAVELKRTFPAPPEDGQGRMKVPIRFLVLLAPLDLDAAEAGAGLKGEVQLSRGGTAMPIPFKLDVPAASLRGDPRQAREPELDGSGQPVPEGPGPCLICGDALYSDGARCASCSTWSHPDCVEALGACPSHGCG